MAKIYDRSGKLVEVPLHVQMYREAADQKISFEQYCNQNYLDWVRGRAAVFEGWISAGKMDPVDPIHLIFLLWSSTQHYADFASQICRVKQCSRLTKQDFEEAADQLVQIILKGCGLTPAAKA